MKYKNSKKIISICICLFLLLIEVIWAGNMAHLLNCPHEHNECAVCVAMDSIVSGLTHIPFVKIIFSLFVFTTVCSVYILLESTDNTLVAKKVRIDD